MTSPVLRSVLEKEAKKFQDSLGLKWTKALDEASKKFGFHNYKHYLNCLPPKGLNSTPLTNPPFKRKTPAHPLHITGGARQIVQEFLELLDKPDAEAYSELLKIALNDLYPFRRFDAAHMLLRNFEIPFAEAIAILRRLPTESLMMIWPHLVREEVIEEKLLQFYMNDGQIQYDQFATHPHIDELSLNNNLQYKLENEQITVSGSFNLSLELQFGSNSDVTRGNGDIQYRTVTGKFSAKLSNEKEIRICTAELNNFSS